jgi:hypothetical protein
MVMVAVPPAPNCPELLVGSMPSWRKRDKRPSQLIIVCRPWQAPWLKLAFQLFEHDRGLRKSNCHRSGLRARPSKPLCRSLHPAKRVKSREAVRSRLSRAGLVQQLQKTASKSPSHHTSHHTSHREDLPLLHCFDFQKFGYSRNWPRQSSYRATQSGPCCEHSAAWRRSGTHAFRMQNGDLVNDGVSPSLASEITVAGIPMLIAGLLNLLLGYWYARDGAKGSVNFRCCRM